MADMSSMILSRPVDVSRYRLHLLWGAENVAPAGMAIAIIREDLLGHAAGSVPTMMNYTTLIGKDSMYNTPPCWCIYMTGLVLDYLEHEVGGLAAMQQINEAKAKVLYDYLDSQNFYKNPRRAPLPQHHERHLHQPRHRDRQKVLRRGRSRRLCQPEGPPAGGRDAGVHLQRHAPCRHRQAGAVYGSVPQSQR